MAKLAGVHPGTASRALNEETCDLVNGETASRVLAAAEELGYRPNPIARGLKTSRSKTVGVLVPDLMNPFFPPVVRGVQDCLEAAGYTPLIANTDNDPERERVDVEAMRARQADGLISATARKGEEDWLVDLSAGDLPVVLINRRVDSDRVASVVGDDIAGIAMAVDHLVGLSHRKLAFIGGPVEVSTGRLRHEGFLKAVADGGAEVDPADILIGEGFLEAEGERLCAELLDRGTEATAIICGNDLLALGCYDVFDARGVGCPAEYSIVGYNDMPFADRFRPPLTTIRVPQYDLGFQAGKLLLGFLSGEGEVGQRHLQLAPTLVVRESTGVPRS